MSNPRDWGSALWIVVRQAVIIAACCGLVFGGCYLIFRAIVSG